MKFFLIAAWVVAFLIALLAVGATFLSIYQPPATANGLYVLNHFAGTCGLIACLLLALLTFITDRVER